MQARLIEEPFQGQRKLLLSGSFNPWALPIQQHHKLWKRPAYEATSGYFDISLGLSQNAGYLSGGSCNGLYWDPSFKGTTTCTNTVYKHSSHCQHYELQAGSSQIR